MSGRYLGVRTRFRLSFGSLFLLSLCVCLSVSVSVSCLCFVFVVVCVFVCACLGFRCSSYLAVTVVNAVCASVAGLPMACSFRKKLARSLACLNSTDDFLPVPGTTENIFLDLGGWYGTTRAWGEQRGGNLLPYQSVRIASLFCLLERTWGDLAVHHVPLFRQGNPKYSLSCVPNVLLQHRLLLSKLFSDLKEQSPKLLDSR